MTDITEINNVQLNQLFLSIKNKKNKYNFKMKHQ